MQKLHVIAISKNLNQNNELDIFVHENGAIYLYSPNDDIEVEWNYKDKINQIVEAVEKGQFEWSDILIGNGQVLTREDDKIFVDGNMVALFSKLSKDSFAQIGPVTAKIYNEYIRSSEKDDIGFREIMKETFTQGFFTKKIADIIEDIFDYPIDQNDLNNLDKQIIVRVKIEGYNFIIDFVKSILASNLSKTNEYCEKFLSRVFMLESQNFIKVETDNIITI